MQTSHDADKKITVQTLDELGPLPLKIALGCSVLLPVAFVLGLVFNHGWDLFAFSYLQSTSTGYGRAQKHVQRLPCHSLECP